MINVTYFPPFQPPLLYDSPLVRLDEVPIGKRIRLTGKTGGAKLVLEDLPEKWTRLKDGETLQIDFSSRPDLITPVCLYVEKTFDQVTWLGATPKVRIFRRTMGERVVFRPDIERSLIDYAPTLITEIGTYRAAKLSDLYREQQETVKKTLLAVTSYPSPFFADLLIATLIGKYGKKEVNLWLQRSVEDLKRDLKGK